MDVPEAATDWTSVGLCLAVVGSFLLGNAMLIRRPRELVRERLGLRGARLVAIRETIFHRIQVGLGFLYLIGGFAIQLVGRLVPEPRTSAPPFPAAWVALIAIATVLLVAMGWWWSARSFRRTLRGLLLERADVLEADPQLVREIGELFGVDSIPEDTVASYAQRVRTAVGIVGLPRRPAPVRAGLNDDAALLDDEDGADGAVSADSMPRSPATLLRAPRSRRAADSVDTQP